MPGTCLCPGSPGSSARDKRLGAGGVQDVVLRSQASGRKSSEAGQASPRQPYLAGPHGAQLGFGTTDEIRFHRTQLRFQSQLPLKTIKTTHPGIPAVPQGDRQHLCSAGTQVRPPAQHRRFRILSCPSYSIGHSGSLDLTPSPGTPYAGGWPKEKRIKKRILRLKNNKTRQKKNTCPHRNRRSNVHSNIHDSQNVETTQVFTSRGTTNKWQSSHTMGRSAAKRTKALIQAAKRRTLRTLSPVQDT